jgi:transposase
VSVEAKLANTVAEWLATPQSRRSAELHARAREAAVALERLPGARKATIEQLLRTLAELDECTSNVARALKLATRETGRTLPGLVPETTGSKTTGARSRRR